MKKASNRKSVFIYLVLAIATLIAYEPVRHNEFLEYDDPVYITENKSVQAGLAKDNIINAFTATDTNFWHPLTLLSHMLDCELFGLNPFGHHVHNLLLHIANTLLLFWVLKRMTEAFWPSAFVAAVFALHPFHVESVAWAAQRKDLLSTLFWILTMAAYFRYAKKTSIKNYMIVFLVFALGLIAKPMLVII